jgi:hypothetical protein
MAAGASTADVEVVGDENENGGNDEGENAKQDEQALEDDQPPPIPFDREAFQIRQAGLIDEYFERQQSNKRIRS